MIKWPRPSNHVLFCPTWWGLGCAALQHAAHQLDQRAPAEGHLPRSKCGGIMRVLLLIMVIVSQNAIKLNPAQARVVNSFQTHSSFFGLCKHAYVCAELHGHAGLCVACRALPLFPPISLTVTLPLCFLLLGACASAAVPVPVQLCLCIAPLPLELPCLAWTERDPTDLTANRFTSMLVARLCPFPPTSSHLRPPGLLGSPALLLTLWPCSQGLRETETGKGSLP